MSKTFNSIGTMSGTSFDGIDVFLAATDGKDVLIIIIIYTKI